jgi:hypothetical protein
MLTWNDHTSTSGFFGTAVHNGGPELRLPHCQEIATGRLGARLAS